MRAGAPLAERNRRAIWGAVNAQGDEASASRDSLPFTARAVRMVERLWGSPNAAVETFFKPIKAELVWRRTWKTSR